MIGEFERKTTQLWQDASRAATYHKQAGREYEARKFTRIADVLKSAAQTISWIEDDDEGDDTPMMRQYKALKREIPAGVILMFRLGDFYEMFGEDAVVASPILGATLVKRGKHPMCGVPFHAINAYLKKLIETGRTVALADVVEEPKPGNIPRREITRIVTPATFEDEGGEEQE